MGTHGIRIEFSDGRAPLTTLADVNAATAGVGMRVWPLDLGSQPADLKQLLRKRDLTAAEAKELKAHFLPPRERLLAIIREAGRAPHLPDAGALETFVSPHDYWYPQLYLVGEGVDYSRFDRFHVNVAPDGTGVDEVLQLLAGGRVKIQQRLPSDDVLTVWLNCPNVHAGWLVTYDGDVPHIGSLSAAQPGTKLLVQAIGAPRWVMRYDV